MNSIFMGLMNPVRPTAAPGSFGSLALEHDEQTDNHREEGGAFHESCSQDHVGADVTGCFWLACDGLESGTTDTTDTNACAESGEAGTQSCNTVAEAKVTCFQEN